MSSAPATSSAATGCTASFAKPPESAFEGGAYAESFVLADVRDGLAARRDARFPCSSRRPGCSSWRRCRADPSGSWRPSRMRPQVPGRGRHPAPARRAGPGRRRRVREVIWASRFRVHHRLAATYRRGPFLLMGDAAHVHSPAGGQGMNTGLVDAVVLARALARVVSGESGDGLLDDYSSLRRPAAGQVLALAGRLTGLAVLRSPIARMLRNLLLRTLNRSAGLQADHEDEPVRSRRGGRLRRASRGRGRKRTDRAGTGC